MAKHSAGGNSIVGPFESKGAELRECHSRMDEERLDKCICRRCVYFGGHRFWEARVHVAN